MTDILDKLCSYRLIRRIKAAFDAPLGTKNAYPVWNKSTEEQEQMNRMKES